MLISPSRCPEWSTALGTGCCSLGTSALLCFALQLVLDFVLSKCVGRSLHDFVFLNLFLLGGRADTYLLALPNEGHFRFRRNVPAGLIMKLFVIFLNLFWICFEFSPGQCPNNPRAVPKQISGSAQPTSCAQTKTNKFVLAWCTQNFAYTLAAYTPQAPELA